MMMDKYSLFECTKEGVYLIILMTVIDENSFTYVYGYDW